MLLCLTSFFVYAQASLPLIFDTAAGRQLSFAILSGQGKKLAQAAVSFAV